MQAQEEGGGTFNICLCWGPFHSVFYQMLLPGGCLAPSLQRVQCDPAGLGGFDVLTSRLQGLLLRRPWQGAFASRES